MGLSFQEQTRRDAAGMHPLFRELFLAPSDDDGEPPAHRRRQRLVRRVRRGGAGEAHAAIS